MHTYIKNTEQSLTEIPNKEAINKGIKTPTPIRQIVGMVTRLFERCLLRKGFAITSPTFVKISSSLSARAMAINVIMIFSLRKKVS